MNEAGEMVGPRRLVRRLGGAAAPRFSLCTLVTDWAEYDACLASFRSHGFGDDLCETLVLDNSRGNRADAFVAVNEFLGAARGDYVLLFHQDVLLLEHGRAELEARLADLDAHDPAWALAGNAGHTDDGWPAICITQENPRETTVAGAPFPARVASLDENFLVVRAAANLAASRDLAGFHQYGADLCIVADVLGWNAWVIDFLLLHKSRGTYDAGYAAALARTGAKYRRALRPRWVHMVGGHSLYLSGAAARERIAGLARAAGKAIGLVPRNRDLYDPAKRARRDRRRGTGSA